MLIGVASGIYTFQPKVSISPGERLDPSNAFRTPFVVQNGGVLPIFDVEGRCLILQALMGRVIAEKMSFGSAADRVSQLWPGDRLLLVSCLQMLSVPGGGRGVFAGTATGPPSTADVTFEATYRVAPFFPWRQRTRARFALYKSIDGYHWLPRAEAAPAPPSLAEPEQNR